jgi:polyhydroxybutyrate depolymerase
MKFIGIVLVCVCWAPPTPSATQPPNRTTGTPGSANDTASDAASVSKREWTVDGVVRTALVCIPPAAKRTAETPLVFCWHGHGGTAVHSRATAAFERAWPEAIVVYPQGLKTASPLVDPEGKKSGWQTAAGNNGDRDIKLYDAMVDSVRAEYKLDGRHIYSAGHSNGGFFSYLLWQTRGATLAAIGPVAGAYLKPTADIKPLPVIHVAGKDDPIVKFSWQERTFENVRAANACTNDGKPWAAEGGLTATLYESSKGAPLVTVIHEGGHEYPKGSSALITRFFKEHAQAAVAATVPK